MATPTSMFGMSPLDVVQQRIQEQEKMNMLRRQQRSQEGSQFGVFAPLYQAGLGFGDIAGQAITQGVFGQQQDPMLKKAIDIQSVLSGRDVTKAEDLAAISKDLINLGYNSEGMQVAKQARDIETGDLDRQIKLAQFGESMTEKKRKTVDYYKKNPEQAEFRLTQLAEIIKNDPGNAAAIQEYEQITRAASEGGIEAKAKAEKETLELETSKVNLQKARQDLQKANTNAQAAIDFFKAYGLDPAKGLDDQPNFKKIPASIRASAGFMPALFDAQQKALTLLKPTTAPSGAPAAGASRANDPLGIRPR
jgi:hypothetical protein